MLTNSTPIEGIGYTKSHSHKQLSVGTLVNFITPGQNSTTFLSHSLAPEGPVEEPASCLLLFLVHDDGFVGCCATHQECIHSSISLTSYFTSLACFREEECRLLFWRELAPRMKMQSSMNKQLWLSWTTNRMGYVTTTTTTTTT